MPTMVVIIDLSKALFGFHLGGSVTLCRELNPLTLLSPDKHSPAKYTVYTTVIARQQLQITRGVLVSTVARGSVGVVWRSGLHTGVKLG